MGIVPQLIRAIPDAEVYLIRAQTWRELISDDDVRGGRSEIPIAGEGWACLEAVGRHAGRLGDVAHRRDLLERANDPGTDAMARCGLRFLLHGSPDHRTDDGARLWIGRHGHHRVWRRLWAAMHTGAQWSLIPEELADAVPRSRWTRANIAEIDARTLIEELRRPGRTIEAPEEFSVEERDEILSCIEDEDLWRRLPLHTTVDGCPVSARESVYLASVPAALDREDPLTCHATLIAPSENESVAARQRRWLRPLDHRARIEMALRTPDSSRHWRSVMDALSRLPDDMPGELRDLLRNTAWLPTAHDAPVKPEDVIDLQGTLRDEAHRLVAEHRVSHGPCFAVPEDLDAAVREHKAWPRIRAIGFSSGPEGLGRLRLLLEHLPDYHIGTWPTQPPPDGTGLLAHYENLPGWRLLAMTATESFGLETAWARLGPALSKAIDVEKLTTVLGWLTGDNDRWKLRKRVHDAYLRQLATHGQTAADHLPRLQLASAHGSWRGIADLCAGAHGVVRESLLDPEQEAILGNLICKAGSGTGGDQPCTGRVSKDSFQKRRSKVLDELRNYFQRWDSSLVPPPMMGVVLALLGPDMRELANEYLHPHSFEWLVGQLPWRDPGRTEWMGGKTAGQALELIEAGVDVLTGNEVEVLNLLGKPIQVPLVPLDQEPETLLAGALKWQGAFILLADGDPGPPGSPRLPAGGAVSWQGGYGVLIPLRRIDPGRFPPHRLGELLRATTERLYSELYNQKSADFGDLWKELDRSHQLEIGIARRLILDHIPFYLRQLSVRHESIEKQLAVCDRWRRRIAETEANGGQSAESARQEWRRALDDLADCIDRHRDEQQAVLQAVKGKLEQYQYDLSSIPLELFQNADDAAVELGQIHAHPAEGCQVPPAARRFVVDEREDGLGFLHWGRPVNARGPVGFNGEGRGYARDLEKMLVLSATDKPGDERVTGKFGLGFKSVLLACEQPRILSGRLAIRVVAGILPQPWEDPRKARQRAGELGEEPGTDSRLPGTLIDLPAVDGERRGRVLYRFLQLAGILCVFGRAVRTVTHVVAGSTSVFRWQPGEIGPGVEMGELELRGDWGARTRALCVRTDNGSVLMATGPRGFRPLPDCVPALWVTAPTREASAVGFAVNGGFDLDAGRGRLAGNTDNNLKKAKSIGAQAGAALGVLLERSREDWNSVRKDLGLAADLDALDFWKSIWLGLTSGWLGSPRNEGKDLARAVALGTLARLCDRPRAVPNGLEQPLHGFSDAGKVRYELSRLLRHQDVGAELGAWQRFTNRYTGEVCVSREIGDILREAQLCSPKQIGQLGLAALVGLLERSRAQPDDAQVLGRLYRLTEDALDWKSTDLRQRLDALLFRSEADEWVKARKLLARHGPGLDPDEPRRHALAPPECRLHSDYSIEAVAFFRECRQRMEAPAEKIAQWVLAAATTDARRTALEYLADGELGEQVAEQVREQDWLRFALNDRGLTEELTEEQQDRLRRRLIPGDCLERAVVQGGDGEYEPIRSHVDLPTALERLYQWWANEGSERAAAYRNRLYPQGPRNLDLRSDPETGRFDRSSWLMLLALGSFQGMGRTREEQHCGFIQECQARDWWDVFTTSNPRKEPERWMNIIEEYAEAQHEDEEWAQWLAQFPKLYRLRRWLDDYADLFRSIDRFEKPFTMETILAPRSNPHFQGGGIDPPPLTRTLKVGFPFIVRELLHHGVIENPLAVPHAYAPIERVKRFFRAFGSEISTSEDIHEILMQHLGEERATFSNDYDIPLRIVSQEPVGFDES